jgi:hypothetical protein
MLVARDRESGILLGELWVGRQLECESVVHIDAGVSSDNQVLDECIGDAYSLC